MIDISRDVEAGQLHRRVNGVSTVSLQVSNKFAKYDRVIARMNRIVVFLKRTHWLQQFAGYVTTAPYETVVPGAVVIEAQCTMKRLNHVFWDKYAPESQVLMPMFGERSQTQIDGGAAASVFKILTAVAKWDPNRILIQKMPRAFIRQAARIAGKVAGELERDPVFREAQRQFDLLLDAAGWAGMTNPTYTGLPTTGASRGGGYTGTGGGGGGVSPGSGGGGGSEVRHGGPQYGGTSSRAQQFITVANDQLGDPYVWGNEGPGAFDCSGLVYFCLKASGLNVSRLSANGLMDRYGLLSRNQLEPGDLLFYNYGRLSSGSADHVGIYIGEGEQIDASSSMNSIVRRQVDWDNFIGGGRVPELNGPAAGLGAPGQGGVGGGFIDPAFNLFLGYPGLDAETAFFQGERAWINDVPIFSTVQDLCRASLRDFQSAPNGDFVAFFPDKFGIWGKAPALLVRDIEVQDFKMSISDDQLTTHVAVAGNMQANIPAVDGIDPDWMNTIGIISVEQQDVMKLMLGLDPKKKYKWIGGDWIVNRFGLRPLRQEADSIFSQAFEFFYAFQLFQQKWTEQFLSTPLFTFLPEMYPGMRVVLEDQNLAFYVEDVVHTFDRQNGFDTQATVSTPMRRVGGEWRILPLERAPQLVPDQDEHIRSGSGDAPDYVGSPQQL